MMTPLNTELQLFTITFSTTIYIHIAFGNSLLYITISNHIIYDLTNDPYAVTIYIASSLAINKTEHTERTYPNALSLIGSNVKIYDLVNFDYVYVN